MESYPNKLIEVYKNKTIKDYFENQHEFSLF